MIDSCIELGIRLFFEMVKYLFAPQALISGDFSTFFSVLIRTAKWAILFIILKLIFKSEFLSNMSVIGTLVLMKAIPTMLMGIPIIGWLLSAATMMALAGVSAIAWGVLILLNEDINPLIRLFILPGIMLAGFINSFWPFSIVLDLGFAVALSTIASVVAILTIIAVLVIIFTPLKIICGWINWVVMRISGL